MLEEYLMDIGYSSKQIYFLRNTYPVSSYSESTLLYNFRNLYQYLKKNNIDNKSFIFITTTVPTILCDSIENIKSKAHDFRLLGFNKVEFFSILKQYPYILWLSFEKIKQKFEQLSTLGFSKTNIHSIVIQYPSIFATDNSCIHKSYQFFLNFGYSSSETISIFTTIPELFQHKNFSNILKEIQKFGFSNTDIIKITSFFPELFLDKFDKILEKFQCLLSVGYTDTDVITFIRKIPFILKSCYLNSLNTKIDTLISFGFLKEDIILMTKSNPYIFLYSTQGLKDKFYAIQTLGYSSSDVIKMMRTCPFLFGYHINTIDEKIKFYKDCNLDFLIVNESNILFYNLDFIKARYKFLSKDKDISRKNYSLLFLDDRDFYQKFSITREELLKGGS